MAEYIERKRYLQLWQWQTTLLQPLIMLWDMVEQAPAADVEPVVHGKWVKAHWRNSVSCANCSICGFEAYHRDFRGAQKHIIFAPTVAQNGFEDSHVPDSED